MTSISSRLATGLCNHIARTERHPPWNASGQVQRYRLASDHRLPEYCTSDQISLLKAHLHHAVLSATHAPADGQETIITTLVQADTALYSAYPGHYDDHSPPLAQPPIQFRDVDVKSPAHKLFESVMPNLWNAANAVSGMPRCDDPQRSLPDPLALAIEMKSQLLVPQVHTAVIAARELALLSVCEEYLKDAVMEVGYAKAYFDSGTNSLARRNLAEAIESAMGVTLHTLKEMTENIEPIELSGDHTLRVSPTIANQHLFPARESVMQAISAILKVDTTRLNAINAQRVHAISSAINEHLKDLNTLTIANGGKDAEIYSSLDQAIPTALHHSWTVDAPLGSPTLPLKAPSELVELSVRSAQVMAAVALPNGAGADTLRSLAASATNPHERATLRRAAIALPNGIGAPTLLALAESVTDLAERTALRKAALIMPKNAGAPTLLVLAQTATDAAEQTALARESQRAAAWSVAVALPQGAGASSLLKLAESATDAEDQKMLRHHARRAAVALPDGAGVGTFVKLAHSAKDDAERTELRTAALTLPNGKVSVALRALADTAINGVERRLIWTAAMELPGQEGHSPLRPLARTTTTTAERTLLRGAAMALPHAQGHYALKALARTATDEVERSSLRTAGVAMSNAWGDRLLEVLAGTVTNVAERRALHAVAGAQPIGRGARLLFALASSEKDPTELRALRGKTRRAAVAMPNGAGARMLSKLASSAIDIEERMAIWAAAMALPNGKGIDTVIELARHATDSAERTLLRRLATTLPEDKANRIIEILAESAPDTGERTASPAAVDVPSGSGGQILQALSESANGVRQRGRFRTLLRSAFRSGSRLLRLPEQSIRRIWCVRRSGN